MTRTAYGTGTITRDRGRFRVRIPDGRGGHLSVGTRATREEAEALLAAALDEATGLALVGVELYAYGERVIERWAQAGQRSVRADRSRWRSIVGRAPFARGAVDAVTRADVRDFARALPTLTASRAVMKRGRVVDRIDTGRPISWQTCKHALGLLGRVYREALDDEIVAVDPTHGIELPPRQERQESWTWLRWPEVVAALRVAKSLEHRTVLTLAVCEGLRQGELAALTWECVDLEGGWLVIARSWDTATKSGVVRRIPLLMPAAAALTAWQPDPVRRRGLVFPSPNGGLYARGHDWGWGDQRYAKSWPVRAGIKRRVPFHALRHTCAVHLVSGTLGKVWTLREVGDLLGHTEDKVTRRYARLTPDSIQQVARETATTLDANLTPIAASKPRRSARKPRQNKPAGDTGIEPVTFGSGGRGDVSDFAVVAGAAAVSRPVEPREAMIEALQHLASDEPHAVRLAIAALERGIAASPALPRERAG